VVSIMVSIPVSVGAGLLFEYGPRADV
jgi:hypothetical protein